MTLRGLARRLDLTPAQTERLLAPFIAHGVVKIRADGTLELDRLVGAAISSSSPAERAHAPGDKEKLPEPLS